MKAHQNTPQAGQNQVSDELKFQVVSEQLQYKFSIVDTKN